MSADFSLRLNYKYIEYILCHLLLIIFIYKYYNTLLYLYSTHKHIIYINIMAILYIWSTLLSWMTNEVSVK